MAATTLVQKLRPVCDRLIDFVDKLESSSPEESKHLTGPQYIVVKTATEISDIAKPTDSLFIDMTVNLAEINATRLFLKWDAFHAIPLEGAISFSDLAHKLDAQVTLIARVARMLSSTGILTLVGTDHVKHSPKSRLLVTDEGASASLRFTLFNDFPGPSLTPEYFEKYGRIEPVSKTHAPYTFARGNPEKTIWEVMDQDSVARTTFLTTMRNTQESLRVTVPYDFSWIVSEAKKSKERTLLVDVGGAGGHTIKDILNSTPGIPRELCVLQDRPEVVEETKAKNDEGLAGVQLMGVDFHREQPIKGAVAYILRRCLHDYGDDESVGILQYLTDAMSPSSKLLIIESAMTPATPSFCYAVDLTMMAIGGKERMLEDWKSLVGRAGLKLANIAEGSGTALSVLECVKA